jgi:hypothetical protein
MNRRLFAQIQARASATEERRGGAERRRQLLAGLSGRVVEVGAGSGVSFAYFPATVRELVAVEPEQNLRERALEAAERARVPVRVVDGVAERLPLPDASVDAVVLAGVLCSVPDPGRVLDEAARVLRPGGELRFYEHVVARNRRLAGLQRLFDATPGHASSAAVTRAATPRRHSSPPGSPSRRASAGRFARPSSQRPSPPASSDARAGKRLSRVVRESGSSSAAASANPLFEMRRRDASNGGGLGRRAEVLVADRDELRRRAEARGARDQQRPSMSGGVPFTRIPNRALLRGAWRSTDAPGGRSGAPFGDRAPEDDSA